MSESSRSDTLEEARTRGPENLFKSAGGTQASLEDEPNRKRDARKSATALTLTPHLAVLQPREGGARRSSRKVTGVNAH
eukprot:5633166-Amphidinium_carterae.1